MLVEVTLIGPVASTLGLLAGFGLSLLLGEAQGIPPLSFPWATMLAFLVLAVILGLIAAIIPALRASRIDVLRAIAYE